MSSRAALVLALVPLAACFGTAPDIEATADTTAMGSGSSGSSGGSGESSGDTGTPPGAPCPTIGGDVIACMDFEDATWEDVLTIDGGAGFSVGEPEAGNHALKITHDAPFVGRAMVLFGDAPMVPGGTVIRGGEMFSEIHLRFRMRTADDWSAPGGFGDLAQIVGMDDISFDNGNAFSVELAVPVDAAVPAGLVVRSCVDGDGMLPCVMGADASQVVASAPLGVDTGDLTNGQWRCVALTMVLDEVGDAVGNVSVASPPDVDVMLDELSLRLGAGIGLNAIHFPTLWAGGTSPQTRWIDDIVISTDPLPCE